MYLVLLLASIIHSITTQQECTVSNPVSNDVNAVVGGVSKIGTSFKVNISDKVIVSCKDNDKDLTYNTPKEYTCTEEIANEDPPKPIALPGCFEKCYKFNEIRNNYTIFRKKNGDKNITDGEKVQSKEPIKVECVKDSGYTLEFGVQSEFLCSNNIKANQACQESCHLTAKNDDTIVTGNSEGLFTLSNEQRLTVGYEVEISCSSATSLPKDTPREIKCNKAGESLKIPLCQVGCWVPVEPANTEYIHPKSNPLQVGADLTIKCTQPLKLPYGEKNIIKCVNSTSFSDLPNCERGCQLSGIPDNVIVQTNGEDLVDTASVNQPVNVTCKDAKQLLPYPLETPWHFTCTKFNTSETVNIPPCQAFCAKDAIKPPENSKLADSTPDRLPNSFPLTVECDDYYNFEPNKPSQVFYCQDASVTFNSQSCHPYAMISVDNIDETNKVKYVVNRGSLGSDVITVQLVIKRGTKVVQTIPIEKDEDVYDFTAYEELSFNLESTSTYDAGSRTAIITNSITAYPGPPSPDVKQKSSNSSSVTIDLSLDGTVDLSNLLNYNIEINNDVYKTKKTTLVIKSLSANGGYPLKAQTELEPKFGGKSSKKEFMIYTGPVAIASVTAAYKGQVAELSWAPVTGADSYIVSFGSNTKSVFTPFADIEPKVGPDTDVTVTVTPQRRANNLFYSGDSFTETLRSGPAAPELSVFKITITSIDITISTQQPTPTTRLRQSGSGGTNVGYVAFLNDDIKLDIPAEGNLTYDMEEGKEYKLALAQKYGSGWGSLTNYDNSIIASACMPLICSGCTLTAANGDPAPSNVSVGTELKIVCDKDFFFDRSTTASETNYTSELGLLCKNVAEYVYTDDESAKFYHSNRLAVCTNDSSVLGGGVVWWYYVIPIIAIIAIILIILLFVWQRRKKTHGTYNAKKAQDTSKLGEPMDAGTNTYTTQQDVFFENRNRDILLGQSMRSMATSYASQELKMVIADDDDSGINGDMDNPVIYNPNLQASFFGDDTISTKSALV